MKSVLFRDRLSDQPPKYGRDKFVGFGRFFLGSDRALQDRGQKLSISGKKSRIWKAGINRRSRGRPLEKPKTLQSFAIC